MTATHPSHSARPGAALLLAACTALLASCTPAPPPGPFQPSPGPQGEGVLGQWVQSGPYEREYVLHTPPDMDSTGSYPLFVFMHGAGATAEGVRAWIQPDSATDAHGFVAVYPEGLDRSWELGCGACTSAGLEGVDDIRFIDTLVRHLARELPVDTTRLFVAGHSLGAQFAYYYACEGAIPPAAIAAVAGLWMRRTAVRCAPRRDLSVMMIHGEADPVLPWEGPRENISALSMPEALERWTGLLECRGEPGVTRVPAGEDGGGVVSTRHGDCRGGASVVLHKLHAGHGWPGLEGGSEGMGPRTRSLDGMETVMDFFQDVAMDPPPYPGPP